MKKGALAMRTLLLLATAVMLMSARPAVAESASIPACTFEQGFKDLHDQIPDVVGDCIMNAQPQPTGDVQQRTKNGLLAWRKADNWTAFTNGAMTWINGPFGAQSRPNDELLGWESLQGFPGTALYPPPSMADTFSGDPVVTYDADGYILTFGSPGGDYAELQGAKGENAFGQYQSGIDECIPGPSYCIFSDSGVAVSEDFLDQSVGGAPTIVSHRFGYGVNWLVFWYDAGADISYSIFVAGTPAERFGGVGAGQSNVAGARALADLASGLVALPRAPAVDAVAVEQPVTLQGTSGKNTDDFTLRGGDYLVEWTATLTERDNCIIDLNSTTDSSYDKGVVNEIYGAGRRRENNHLYSVQPGRYYFYVLGCGNWQITIRPQ